MIDAHQHFWTTTRDDYGWLTPEDETLYRDFGPADLQPWLERAGIARSVVVQAAPTVAETRYLLTLANANERVAGVVGWVPLDAPDVGATLEAIGADPLLKGVRPMIQDIADDAWMLGDAVGPGLEELTRRELAFDALVHPRHLKNLRELAAAHPQLRIVVDHAAKPAIRARDLTGWAREMRVLARDTSVLCKLSGLVTEADARWSLDDLRPVVEHLLEHFGPQRLMWGSDWPVVELAGGYMPWWEATAALLCELSDAERADVLGRNACAFYRL